MKLFYVTRFIIYSVPPCCADGFCFPTTEEPAGPKKKKAKGEAAAVPAKPKSMPGTSGAAAVDMAAWQGLGLGPGVLNAIANLGFAEPTPIQRECLLPAIRDRRDVIGAAQTVCVYLKIPACPYFSFPACLTCMPRHMPSLCL